MARLSFPIGLQRIGASVPASSAEYTRSIRAQMDQIIKNMQTVINSIEGESPDALLYATRPIFDTSQELVPVKTGVLKASGYHEVQQGPRGTKVVVGYARGGYPDYAVFVHERMDLYHTPPTQAKFLEEAINRHIDEIVPRYAEYVRLQLGL